MKKYIITVLLSIISFTNGQVIIGDAVGTNAVDKSSILLEFADQNNKGIILPYVKTLPTVSSANAGTILLDATNSAEARIKYSNGTNWIDMSGQNGLVPNTIVSNQPTSVSESVGKAIIGATTSSADGVLVLESTTKVMVLPTVTNVQNIPSPSPGMMVYVKGLTPNFNKRLAFFNGTKWSFWKCGSFITSINCGGAVNSGTLTQSIAASGVSSSIPYSGGGGGENPGQIVTSTGVTGLTATLSPGTFMEGNGTLIYNITGTPTSSGVANFAINVGGQICTLTRIVEVGAGTIATINCAGSTSSGTLTRGVAASGVSSSIPYTGGNGGVYGGQIVTSTGVTGLTATLTAGNFSNGVGNLIYNITGTPNAPGIASFAINIGGQSCTLTRTVAASAIRLGRMDTYSIGSSQLATFNTQLNNTSNYGTGGTYNKITAFTVTDITATTFTGAQLKNSYDIISTGYRELNTAQANALKDYVDLGGVVLALLDTNVGTNLNIVFGGSGTVGGGNSVNVLTNTNGINNGVFGDGRSISVPGNQTDSSLLVSNLPAGATLLATKSSGSVAGVWLTGSGNRAIFVWDEGAFRSTSVVGTVIDNAQERFLHNLMAYAIDKALDL